VVTSGCNPDHLRERFVQLQDADTSAIRHEGDCVVSADLSLLNEDRVSFLQLDEGHVLVDRLSDSAVPLQMLLEHHLER
jgi:hypothetical protein